MKQHQEKIDKIFKENGWQYWAPLSILARLFEEGGEFARLVNHLYGEKPKKNTEEEQHLEEEIGDILYTLVCFANSHNIDLDKAIQMTIEKVKTRDKDRWDKK
ncbi:MAG: MazG nucleotide pyrophosphohydrolase domain-containing protein [Patescibacteria group bacterium]